MKSINEAIASHGFFRGMKPEHLALLPEGARAVQFKSGDLIFREGAPASEFYLIETGEIALEALDSANRPTLVHRVQSGDVLGWSWLFPPFTWHFQARAIEPTRAIVLNGAHLLIAAEHNHDFGYELTK